MFELFHYGFIVRAFIAGIIVAITAPLIGTFLVAKRHAMFADTLAHVSLAGITLGIVIGVNPVLTALLVAVVSALLIEELRRKNLSGETALSLFLSGGLALAVVLIGFKRGFNVDIFSYLFGSIATVSESDLFIIGILGIVTVLTVKMLYKELLYTVFNEEMARVSGMSTHMLNFVLTTLTAVVVVASIRIVGVLLIGALMVIPVVTASLISKSFKQTLLLSVVLSLCVVITGLFASYYFNVPAGGSIVLLALGVFGLVSINKKGSW